MKTLNVLILGSGGREQALAWKIAQSKQVRKIFLAPGNAGKFEKCHNIAISLNDFEGIAEVIRKEAISLLIVGPEAPLVDGIVDYLETLSDLKELHIVGPSRKGALLEGSKDFAKAFMLRHGIPTARHQTFTPETLEEGKRYLREVEQPPYVLKADGLAAGKGVLILDNIEEAESALEEVLGGKFGQAGNKVVVETFLSGIECSLFVLTDGKGYTLLPMAKDYKRIGEGDKGLNTGGMGAISPVPFADEKFTSKVEERIVKPTIEGLSKESINYKGFIFIGLINCNGEPFVIEYNCRMGDPETEAVMLRIDGDLVPSLMSLKGQKISEYPLAQKPESVATVVTVSGGYPEAYESGKEIFGLDQVTESVVFHAGTKEDSQGRVFSAGGRVLAVSSIGDSIQEAIQKSYRSLEKISYEKLYYRKDIGQDLIKWLEK